MNFEVPTGMNIKTAVFGMWGSEVVDEHQNFRDPAASIFRYQKTVILKENLLQNQSGYAIVILWT
jgi:hypothetical protein